MVNKSELSAKQWLMKNKGYKDNEIVKNKKGTPDFIGNDGKRYEVKYYNGGQLMFTVSQCKSLLPEDIILVFDNNGYLDQFLWKNKNKFWIKIYYWDAKTNRHIVISEETIKKLEKFGKFGESYEDIILKLLESKKVKGGIK
jgi:hypothetical protein